MEENKKPNKKESQDKVELAKAITKQRQKVAKTYETIEDSILRIIRWLSSWVDRILFSQRYGKVVAVFLAVLLYLTVNFGGNILESQITQSADLGMVPVTSTVNDTLYEVSGLPSEVEVKIFGDASDLQMVRNQGNYKIVADLSGLTEGQHQIKLTAVDISSRVQVAINPSTVVVDIKKKVTTTFNITYDFINTNKMDQMYSLGEPTLAQTDVIIRASQSTIDSISYVKALIDVSGKTSSFEAEAPLVAYNSKGEKLDVDLTPNIVKVSVPVSSPSKTVPIVVAPVGEIPNDMAIDSIILDHSSVILYANDSVLSKYTEVKVNIDASKLTGDSSFYENLSLPSGVRKASITKVNMDIKLKPAETKVIEGIPIMVENNVNGYLVSQKDLDTEISVTIKGTATNIAGIDAYNIGTVYIDMKDIEPGEQEVTLYFKGGNPLVNYTLEKQTITITVIESGD